MKDFNKKILIIDDEEPLREIITEVIEIMDLNGISAASGQEAITIFDEQKDDIGLIILDLYMPGLSGHDTYKRINEIKQNVPVIFMSGYDDQDTENQLTSDVKSTFLKKPFTLNEIKASIESLI
ncbi:MAG: response regulator [Caldithrix sp.]|nr:response regulator [Caldithrix sp.]